MLNQNTATRRKRMPDIAEPPPHVGINAETGLGKSQEIINNATGLLNRMLYPVPHHQLSAEMLTRFTNAGTKNVAVYKGRLFQSKDDKKAKMYPMCQRPDTVKYVQDKLLLDAATFACGSPKNPGRVCPYYNTCLFQQQKVAARKADIIILANQLLFHDPAKLEIGGNFGLAVIDETFWQSGLKLGQIVKMAGFAANVDQFPPLKSGATPEETAAHTKIRREPGEPPRPMLPDALLQSQLKDTHAKLEQVFEFHGAGELVSRATLERFFLSADECHRAAAAEWMRKVIPNMHAGMTKAEIKKAGQAARNNACLPNYAALFLELETLLRSDHPATGRVQIGWKRDNDGNLGAFRLHIRREIAKEILAMPIIYLDATMPDDAFIRNFIPRFERVGDFTATAPHMTLVQITGHWGKNSLVDEKVAAENSGGAATADDGEDSDEDSDEEGGDGPDEDGGADIDPAVLTGIGARNTDRAKKRAEIRDFIAGKVRKAVLAAGSDREHECVALLVTYQGAEEFFEGIPGLDVIHFNNYAGLDKYGHVRLLFVLGCPAATDAEINVIVRTATGLPYPVQKVTFRDRWVNMVDGSRRTVKVRFYNEPQHEAVRVSISDGQVIQGLGRARPINRTAETPLTAYLMTDVVQHHPLNALMSWEDIELCRPERTAARGLYLTAAGDAAAAYPDLFDTSRAAEEALIGVKLLQKCSMPCIPLSKIYILILKGMQGMLSLGNENGFQPDPEVAARSVFWLFSAEYRPAMRGQRSRTAWVSPDRVASLEADLTAACGPLTYCRIAPELTYVKVIPAADPIPDGWEEA